MEKDQYKQFYEKLESYGVSRRQFMKYCGFLTATMGLSSFHGQTMWRKFLHHPNKDRRWYGFISESVRDVRKHC
jgi:Ni,Fe-hydrogenase I small subunit